MVIKPRLRPGPGYQSSSHPGTIKPFLIRPNYLGNPGPAPPQHHLSPQQHFQQQQKPQQQLPLSSPLSHNELLSQISSLPPRPPAHFRLFPTGLAKTPGILENSNSGSVTGASQLSSHVTSSEGNHFKTTPLPRHGPSAGYGYTTTNSFVNVHFGEAPASGHLGTSHSLSTSSPVRFTDDRAAEKWSKISRYHLNNQKPISRPNHSGLMSLDSHIKQTTARPAAILPPLTPTVGRASLSPFHQDKDKVTSNYHFAKKPSIRFDHLESFPQARPVTLPPLVRNVVDEPLFVR